MSRLLIATDFYDRYKNPAEYINESDVEEWEDVFEHYEDAVESQIEIFKEDLKNEFGADAQYLLWGTVGFWNGRFEGGAFCKNVDELYYNLCKEDNFTVRAEDDGRVIADLYHHDSSHNFEIRVISEEGTKLIEDEGVYSGSVEWLRILSQDNNSKKLNEGGALFEFEA